MATVVPEKPALRSERQIEREAKILAVAREELTRKGYDGVTMQALAEKAGVVKKTLYNRYGSKDRLLLAAVSDVVNSYRGGAGQAEPGIPALIAHRATASRTLVAAPEYARAMTSALMQADPGHPLVKVLLADAIADYVVHLQAAADNGELEEGASISLLAEQLAGQAWGLILLWAKGLVPLAEFEARSRTGLLTLLLASTRGPRRDGLAEMRKAVIHPLHGGPTP